MIDYELSNLQAMTKAHDPDIVKKALATSLTRTTKKTATQVSKAVRQVWNIKAARIKNELTLKNAASGDGAKVLHYVGRRIGLMHFGASVTGSGRKRKVKARIRKASGRRIVKDAFIATGSKSGSPQVFKRVGAARLPITKLVGPSVSHMVGSAGVLDEVNAFINKDLPIEFNRNMTFFLDKAGAR